MAKRAKPISKAKKILISVGIIFLLLIVGAFAMMGLDYGFIEDGSVIVPVDREDGKINVLLLGVDVEGLRTDAIMVASYDIKENKVNMLSIPRDTRMYIGTRYQKINAAHAIGGMKGKIAGPEGTVEAVTRLTGIPINYYLEFSFSAIDHFSEIIGPVKFDVPDVEGSGRGMNYEDPYQDLYIHLKAGEQELVGNQVQQLLRYRKSMYRDKNGNRLGYADGDRGRVQMQQDFVKAAVDQKLNPALILKLPDIFSKLSEDIKTNMTFAEIAKYSRYLQGFSSENIATYQLPGEDKTISQASYWICDLEATRELVETVFGYDASKITIDSPDGKKKDTQTSSEDTSSGKSTAAPKRSINVIEDEPDDEDEPVKRTPAPSASPKSTESPDAGEKGDDNNKEKENSGTSSDKTPEPKSADKKEDTDNVTNESSSQTTAPENKNDSDSEIKTSAQDQSEDKKPARATPNPMQSDSDPINIDE